jgi:hypothetical protein
MLYYFGKSKLIPGAYAPGMYKTYFLKLKKFSKKISHVEGHVLYMFARKVLHIIQKKIGSPKFCLFTQGIKYFGFC